MEWLEEYGGESTARLLELGKSHQRGSLLGALHEGLSQKSFRLGGRLTEPELFVLAVTVLDQEVKIGGFGQFLVNSSSRFLPVVAPALEAIGAVKKAELTRQILADLPADWETLGLDEFSRLFRNADATYYALDREEEGHGELLWNYLRAHEQHIVLP